MGGAGFNAKAQRRKDAKQNEAISRTGQVYFGGRVNIKNRPIHSRYYGLMPL
jgi:hypothetical protein